MTAAKQNVKNFTEALKQIEQKIFSGFLPKSFKRYSSQTRIYVTLQFQIPIFL